MDKDRCLYFARGFFDVMPMWDVVGGNAKIMGYLQCESHAQMIRTKLLMYVSWLLVARETWLHKDCNHTEAKQLIIFSFDPSGGMISSLGGTNMNKSSIHGVLIVEESTNIPKVQQLLPSVFNGMNMFEDAKSIEIIVKENGYHCRQKIHSYMLQSRLEHDMPAIAIDLATPIIFEELPKILARVHESMLLSLVQGFMIIKASIAADTILILKMLPFRVVKLGWKLLEFWYVSNYHI